MRRTNWLSAEKAIKSRRGYRAGRYHVLVLAPQKRVESINAKRLVIMPVFEVATKAWGLLTLNSDSGLESEILPQLIGEVDRNFKEYFVWKPKLNESSRIFSRILSKLSDDDPIKSTLAKLRDFVDDSKARFDLVIVVPRVGIFIFEVLGVKNDADYETSTQGKLSRLNALSLSHLYVSKINCRGVRNEKREDLNMAINLIRGKSRGEAPGA